jgi:Flp pilus assembly protein TadD
VLEALDRPDEARTAYERAAAIWPGAQTPAVALASLLERQGKRADAVKAAAAARRAPSEVIDPWWQYWSGDLRFFDQYLAALRGTQP